MDTGDLDHRFDYHPPSSGGIVSQHTEVRGRCLKLARFIDDVIPDSREKSLALTKLEEVMYWTNAGVARINNYSQPGRDAAGQ